MLTETQLHDLLEQMNLEEKIGMVHGDEIFRTKGVKRLNIPPLRMSDGPMGVRREFLGKTWGWHIKGDDMVSYFPSNSALAATWNTEHAYLFGRALGAEARSRNKDVILAPGINIIRSPLCGRNFEYMSEDPYLIKKMAVPLIKGIQENDVAACVKHFAVNNQETDRLKVNVEADERSMEEIYFPGFKAAVQEGKSKTIMAAYNRLRGDYCCESTYLLQEVLRKRWGFEGVIISDWNACHSTEKAARAGLDIEMAVYTDFDKYYFADNLYNMVSSGEIPEEIVDEKVMHILKLMNELNMLDGTRQTGERNTIEHQVYTLKTAEESIVLLKNEKNILPLDARKIKSLAIVGENAIIAHSEGGGSAEIKALYEHTPFTGISMYLGGACEIGYARGYTSDENADRHVRFDLREEAKRIASAYETVIFVGGLNHRHDVEGKDRTEYQLPYEQDELIKELWCINENLVVVNMSGTAVDLKVASECSRALLQTWYNGMEGGRALANILFGDANPSGKLPFTFAKELTDYSSHSIGEFPGVKDVNYTESIYVGYRHFDARDIAPMYAFGYGLSYTEYKYSNIKADVKKDSVIVSCDVENTGNADGREAVQLYIHDKVSEENRPIKELKGFEKIDLKMGESKSVQFTLLRDDFSYFNSTKGRWVMEAGEFDILIGASSDDIRLETTVEIKNI
ncbi:MAG: glycoside hydrolase family 3 C-terminal domain-containing protein [Clostridia bacterium]|nr:glycoside hydrolase family 3 C-terminal domain-containing protein [Clostridia bacterium]